MPDDSEMMEPGGTFTGCPEGVFLYPWMFNQVWQHTHTRRPDQRYFNGRNFLLLRRVQYQAVGEIMPQAAHPGLISDGGTIRTAVGWRIISTPFRDFLPAFLVHDQICRDAHQLAKADRQAAKQLRLLGDRLTYPMLLDLGASHWQARSVYNAVRVGAWTSDLV